jgi:hypothetical protein
VLPHVQSHKYHMKYSKFSILATIIILTMWPGHGAPIMLPFFFLEPLEVLLLLFGIAHNKIFI